MLLAESPKNRFSTASVKTGKSRSEQVFSDLPPEADLTADIVDVSQVPHPDNPLPSPQQTLLRRS
jgi:hypothetical protein